MRLNKISDLAKIIDSEKVAIYGTGWIAKLLFLYIYHSKNSFENIEIIKSHKDTDIHWNQPILEWVSNDSIPIIIAEKEMQGKEQLTLKKFMGKNVYYISENLKNDIDSKIMLEFPNEYELQVLNSRKKELDFNMTRKIGGMIQRITSQGTFPIFDGIEFETINRCNGECSFCPVNKFDDTRQMKKMSVALFEKIVSELKNVNFKGRVAMYSNNEPFLDSRIIELTKYARQELPDAYIYIFTNASLLNLQKFSEIIGNLDLMCLDLYYDKLEEIDSDCIREITEYCEKNNLCNKVMIQTINKKAIRNNRGGGSKNRTIVYKPKAPCILPFTQMIVRPDGKVSLCCNDPLGEYTLADLNKMTIEEAWNSDTYQSIRNKIEKSRQLIEKCALCDNYSTINQNRNMIFTQTQISDSWEAYRNKLESIKSYNG